MLYLLVFMVAICCIYWYLWVFIGMYGGYMLYVLVFMVIYWLCIGIYFYLLVIYLYLWLFICYLLVFMVVVVLCISCNLMYFL